MQKQPEVNFFSFDAEVGIIALLYLTLIINFFLVVQEIIRKKNNTLPLSESAINLSSNAEQVYKINDTVEDLLN
jgi:hypothetical protein